MSEKTGVSMGQEKQRSRQLAKTWPYQRYRTFRQTLSEAAANWFNEKKCKTHSKMAYCLADRNQWQQNIICSEVVDYIHKKQQEHKGIKSFPLHRYLHHGLSSQAMIFNLVGPLIVRDDFEPLKKAIEKVGIPWPLGQVKAAFEHDDRAVFNEESGQPTSIDVFFQGDDNDLFLEAKLVEHDFGGCSIFAAGDCEGRNPYPNRLEECYLHHIDRKYWLYAELQGISRSSIFEGEICPFASYYQFFREVMFAFAQQGSFVLLHDERNPAFYRPALNKMEAGGLWEFLYRSVPQSLRQRVARLTVQLVVEAIERAGGHEDWIGDFKSKYAL
jgi:hypothetical protein